MSASTPQTDSSPLTSSELRTFYTDYIACINGGVTSMRDHLSNFCQPLVEWSGRRLPLATYRTLMEETFDSISGVRFEVTVLVVDEDKQQIASRIEFGGTPVKKYAGVESNGRDVKFAEHAMYWLEGGKIARVETVIDWDAYRKQMGG